MCRARARRAPRPRSTPGSAQLLNLTLEPLDHLRLDSVERNVERLALWRARWRGGVLVGVLAVGGQPNGSADAPLCGHRWAWDPIACSISALFVKRRQQVR
jgi:hypothetical protein